MNKTRNINEERNYYSYDTEILTIKGWKKIKEIKENETINTLNMDKETIETSVVVKTKKDLFNEDFIQLKNRRIDCFVNDTHKLRAQQNTSYQLTNAKNIKAYYTSTIKGFNWTVGDNTKYFTLPPVEQKEQYTRKNIYVCPKKIKMECWLEFFGMWLADGCCRTGVNTQKNNRYVVSIKQKEDDYIEQLYENIGFPCKVYRNKSGNHNYNVYSKQLWTYLYQFGKSKNKYIPNYLLSLNKKYLSFLYKGYKNGDSHKHNEQFYLSTTSKKLSENIQELLLKVEGRLVQFTRRNTKYKNKDYEFYIASFSTNDYQNNLKYNKSKQINYKGYAYMLKTNNKNILITRRNGIVSIVGI